MAESKKYKSSFKSNSPRLFTPLITRGAESTYAGAIVATPVDGSTLETTNASSDNTILYQNTSDGIISTQQLNINWDNFPSHTFFQSAQVKVNTAFDLILNEYKFDGTQKEVEEFLDGLTGYEKWVFDNFPKYEGYLYFSGSAIDEQGGTYVTIDDIAGTAFSEFSTNTSGKSYLNPGTNSFTIEFHIRVPEQTNEGQFILDKHIETAGIPDGWAITLLSSSSTSSADAVFHAFNGGKYLNVTASFQKGDWNHLAFVWHRIENSGSLTSYVNQEIYKQTNLYFGFDSINQNTQSLYIGTGSQVTGYINTRQTLSGALDELRIWSAAKTREELKADATKTIFAQNNLLAYYRFDESIQDYSNQSNVVIDSSGKSLHGKLSSTGMVLGVRSNTTSSYGFSSPMVNARMKYLPILFPKDPSVVSYYEQRMSGAADFDQKNPSLITKLVPKHYILEGMQSEGITTEEGAIVDSYSSGVDPKTMEVGGTQTFLLLLYTFAKFFDEIKLYTKAFADLSWTDYDETNTTPDVFLKRFAKKLGVDLPALFQGASLQQFVHGDNIDNSISINSLSLQQIQNKIWRRLLVNMPDILKSRGTTYAIKQFVRSIGLEPDAVFRIREYGGATKRSLHQSREDKVETVNFIDFYNQPSASINTPYLFQDGTRIEPGYPTSDNTSGFQDFTNSFFSGSWTYEGWYKLNPNSQFYSQSLARVQVYGNGPYTSGSFDALLGNIVANDQGELYFYWNVDSNTTNSAYTLALSLSADLYDGNLWHISVGRRRWDDGLNSEVSSSFFLRAAKKVGNEILERTEATAYFSDFQADYYKTGMTVPNFACFIAPGAGISSSYIAIGNETRSFRSFALNDPTKAPDIARTFDFDGKVTEVKFFTKYIDDVEYLEHVRNLRSAGVRNPMTNWNFDYYASGSWQRLRTHYTFDQPVTSSDGSGLISITDFSQQNKYLGYDLYKFDMSGFGFTPNTTVIVPEDIWYNQISPKFDTSATVEKIRIRGFNDENSIENAWENFGPAYDLDKNEAPTDSTKISIDFSIIDALDKDIITIFGNLDEFDNALGAPENQFEESYVQLEVIRKNYFNKLKDKMNLRGFFMFYKWFDTNFGTYIGQLLPYNAKFNGSNYVIESHMLERAKVKYYSDDVYHGEGNRDYLKTQITTQFITGKLGRY